MSTDETPRPKPDRPTIQEVLTKYQTPIACVATSVATAYFTKSIVLKVSKQMFYTLGQQHTVVELQRDLLLMFVNEKGLDDEVRQYVKTLGNK